GYIVEPLWLDDGLPEVCDLGLQICERAGVFDHVICEPPLFFYRQLGRFAARQFLVGPAAEAGSLAPGFPRRLDEGDGLADFVPAGFEEQRGVDDDCWHGLVGEAIDLVEDALADAWVRELFEELAVRGGLWGIIENALGD